jgi:hypothetical protein
MREQTAATIGASLPALFALLALLLLSLFEFEGIGKISSLDFTHFVCPFLLRLGCLQWALYECPLEA